MVYPKEERNKHWREIIKEYFNFKKGYAKITTEDIKKIIADKEIRLLLYFDSEETMPQALKENSIMLFPNSITSWWLIKCDGFLDLRPINTQIIKFNLGDEELYFSMMGKQRSTEFDLTIAGHTIKIEKPGIEIDAGFEGGNFSVVVEAKAKIIKRISRRQLYFPYMHVKKITSKPTIPIFFCWDSKTKTYNLWRFEIVNDNIENIRLVESKRYSLI